MSNGILASKTVDLRFVAALLLALLLAPTQAAPPGTEEKTQSRPVPIDGGRNWQRELDHARKEARHQKKPLLILAGELPVPVVGRLKGTNIFPHPLIAEAAESLFIPVALSPNLADPTARSVNLYTRETGTRPSIRILGTEGTDIVQPISGNFSDQMAVVPMITALRALDISPPEYLFLTREEAMCHARGLRQATLGMHCFWEGEIALGRIAGVVSTTPGMIGDQEVVDLKFDPLRTSYEQLIKIAQAEKCADKVYTRNATQLATARKIVGKAALPLDDKIKPDGDPKHHLAKTPLKFLPLTQLQAIRINAALAEGAEYKQMLSPRQLLLLDVIEKNPTAKWPVAIGKDIRKVWFETLVLANALDAG